MIAFQERKTSVTKIFILMQRVLALIRIILVPFIGIVRSFPPPCNPHTSQELASKTLLETDLPGPEVLQELGRRAQIRGQCGPCAWSYPLGCMGVMDKSSGGFGDLRQGDSFVLLFTQSTGRCPAVKERENNEAKGLVWTSGLAAASAYPYDICAPESGLAMSRGTMAGMKGWAADMGREKQPRWSPQEVRELSRCWRRQTRMKAAPYFGDDK